MYVTNFPAFSDPQSGRCRTRRQVVAPAGRSEIRDGAPWEGERRSSLRSTLQDAHPSWAGTSGLWLRIHLCAKYKTALVVISEERERGKKTKTIGGNCCWNDQLGKEDFVMQRTFDASIFSQFVLTVPLGRIVFYSTIEASLIKKTKMCKFVILLLSANVATYIILYNIVHAYQAFLYI